MEGLNRIGFRFQVSGLTAKFAKVHAKNAKKFLS